MMWVMWSLVSVHWEPVSVQDRCMVCAKHTIGSYVIFDALDGTLGDVAKVEACLGPFGDSANPDVR